SSGSTAPHWRRAHSTGSATRAQADAPRRASPAESTSRPTYNGLRERAKGPVLMTVVVAPAGSRAVRWRPIVHSAHPFQAANTRTRSRPAVVVARVAWSGSLSSDETSRPSTSGPPTDIGGHPPQPAPA